MAALAVDFNLVVVMAPLLGGAVVVLALRWAVAEARRREQIRIRQLLKSFDVP